jgi:hypothetical protein
MENKFKIFGFTDEVTNCDCCGKTGLKGTFAVELLSSGEILHYGSVCVTRNTGIAHPKTAADEYRAERTRAAQAILRQSPEYRAQEAKFAQRNALPAMGFPKAYEFVKAECLALDAVRVRLQAEYKLDSLLC